MFQNLIIDSWQKLVLYLSTLAVIILLYWMAKKKVKFSYRVLVAMGLGLSIGLLLGDVAVTIRPIGQLYVRLIMMLVVPLVFASIIRSFTQLEDTHKLKSIGLKALFWLLVSTSIATMIGLIFAVTFNLGAGFDVSEITYTPREVVPIEQVLLNLFPNNIISHMASNQMIPVIIFAIFISVAVIIESRKRPEKVKPFKDFINSFADVMVSLTKIVIRFTPYGVFALMANAAGRNNLDTDRKSVV